MVHNFAKVLLSVSNFIFFQKKRNISRILFFSFKKQANKHELIAEN